VEIETQEEWEELLAREGLVVIDVYQGWCGPCKAMHSIVGRLKNDLGDAHLHFAVAKADTVNALERYRGKCRPCYLIYAGGQLVGVVRGANAPLLTSTVSQQLAHEKKVMQGMAERREIRDPEIDDDEDDETNAAPPPAAVKSEENLTAAASKESLASRRDSQDLEGDPIPVTVAIIKPDAVQAGNVDAILDQIRDGGIEILKQEERCLTEEEAKEFYKDHKDEEYFEAMVSFLTSGPSHVLILAANDQGTGSADVVGVWRGLIGPPDVDLAKEESPASLRAKFGSSMVMNAVHGSDSSENAARELAFFFPTYVCPRSRRRKRKVERTLAIIRPSAVKQHREAILETIKESGFEIALQKEMQLTREQVEDFYAEHQGTEYYDSLIDNMVSGPVLALGLARDDAVKVWRSKLGPKEKEALAEESESLRAKFDTGEPFNAIHGSDSKRSAKKEIEMFFPREKTLAAIKPDAIDHKEEIMSNIRDAGFHIVAEKKLALTKDIAEEFYREHQGKEFYDGLVNHMTSGETLFMVLEREDAVDGWRHLIGPTDPSMAKEELPESLRATFGTDVILNALHGSSTPQSAREKIVGLFPDLDLEAVAADEEDPLDSPADGDTSDVAEDG